MNLWALDSADLMQVLNCPKKTNKRASERASRKDNMKIHEWGVFVERPDKSTYEIKLSEELASKVYNYIEKLKEDDENILSGNTEGKILW